MFGTLEIEIYNKKLFDKYVEVPKSQMLCSKML